MATAAVIIIGNEILTGKFADENAPFLIRRLRELGTDLRRIATIADDRETIAAEVAHCSAAFDHVFTTGGVGPTHDDVTLESVAQAFGEKAVPHPRLVQLLEAAGLRDAHSLRMATVPEGTELLWDGGVSFPVIRVRNVYVFPGVPKLLRAKFEPISHRFEGAPMLTARVHTNERETAIAARLQAVQDAFPSVDIGSYPRFGDEPWRVIVTLESRDAGALAAAERAVQEQLTVSE